MSWFVHKIPVLFAFIGLVPLPVFAQLEFETAPIHYSEATPNDAITELQAKLDRGEVELTYDEKNDYLPALLDALGIETSSQTLVFSKTSLQLRRITPARPRSIYFNDETYIGWVQNGDVLEISTTDPELGAVFYTLSTKKSEHPQFVRDKGQCLTCHASSRTEGVPGHLMRSVFADRGGQPHFGSGTYRTTQSSPFEKRWGGWYVSGTHGDLRHMGNVISDDAIRPEELDRNRGANVTDLAKIVDTSPYLEDTSDIVALTVLGHQLQMHNLLTRGSFETRNALHYNQVMNTALERPEDYISESTQRRVSSVSEKIVKCMLFADEEQLNSPICGNSNFRKDFESIGVRDSQGRSLRDFDLQTRMFKYPCSYLIYSSAFDKLPELIQTDVTQRLYTILTSPPTEEDDFANLSQADRDNILSILNSTKPELFASLAQKE